MGLHRNEKEILRVLFKEGRALTLQEIAIDAGMSWLTVKKYIKVMEDRKLVSKTKDSKRTKYQIKPALLEALTRRKDEAHQ